MEKSIKKQAQDYIDDPRWKETSTLIGKSLVVEASILAGKIMDSYPRKVREEANSLIKTIRRINHAES